MSFNLKVCCFLASVFVSYSSYSQSQGQIYMTGKSILSKVKVYSNTKEKISAWAGGVDNPQFALGDLNRDGKKDLVVYGYNTHNVKTFINTGGSYVYAPDYELNFPDEISIYVKLEDYNKDGIADLITHGGQGFVAYKGYYNSSNQLCFKLHKNLRYTDWSGTINATVGTYDLPGVADIDNDGDFDLVAYGTGLNIGYLNYYKNCSLDKDSFDICLKDECWGKLFQFVERTQWLGMNCNSWAHTTCKGTKPTDGYNTVCLLDYDGDGDYDYLNGNSLYSDIQLLINGRVEYNKQVDTIIRQDTIWQGNGRTMIMNKYPAAYWLDIDGDNDKDLLFSPFNTGTENYQCAAYYKNIGSNNSPNFKFQSDSFLVEDMIDLGSTSYPLLYDYNRDGKPDLFVGSEGYYQASGNYRSKLSYYKNTSVGTTGSLTLQTDDFLNISTLNQGGAAPAIGDLDNDGKDDLVIGKTDGTLMFYKNNAATGSDQPLWQTPVALRDHVNNIIDAGNFAAPCIYDIDKDGKPDLLIGCQKGTLHYFRNTSISPGTLALNYITAKLGGVTTILDTLTQAYGYSTPFIGKIDNTGKDYLLLGNLSGVIIRYDSFQNGVVTKPFARIDTMYSKIQMEIRTAPAVGDIDSDGKYEMIIGNHLGGLNLYQQVFNINIDDVTKQANKLSLFPNPVTSVLSVLVEGENIQNEALIYVYNNMGQIALIKQGLLNNGRIDLDLSSLPAGVFLCTVRNSGQVITGTFVKTE